MPADPSSLRPQEDDAVLLCMPLTGTAVVAGSLRKLCDMCNQPIAASRASLNAVIDAATKKNVKWWLICLKCAPDCLPQDPELMPPTPDQFKEITAELRRRRPDA